MTPGGIAILVFFALLVGGEIGLWLGDKLDTPPPADEPQDIDWDNAA